MKEYSFVKRIISICPSCVYQVNRSLFVFVSSFMERIERKKIFISDTIGHISVEILRSQHTRYVMVLAHGAGAGMDHGFMKQLAVALGEYGIDTIRFNFPYMENNKRRPDVPAVAHKAIQMVVEEAKSLNANVPLILAGKSFGGRMSSQLMATKSIEYVRALVFYGFPLHPANKPGVDRAAHLHDVKVPMLFLQGTRDALAHNELIKDVCGSLPNATLIEIEGADHSFKVGKKDSIVDLAKNSFDYLNSLHFA